MCKVVFVLVFVLVIKDAYLQLAPVCTCVTKNTCYQNLSFDGSGAIDIRIVSPTDTTVAPSAPPPTTAPGVCAPGYDLCCTGPSVAGCGLRYNVPPVPGIIASPGQARYGSQPWQTIVFADGVPVGGGALIDQSNVVTAAHKVAGRNPTSVKVRLGEWNASSTSEPFPVQESVVSAIFVNPGYNSNMSASVPGNLFNDVAVLRLATPINLVNNPVIDTICLPTATASFDNMRCLVSGWGKDAFTGNLQSVQREVEVPVIPYADCQNRLRLTRLTSLFNLDPTSFICAGGEPGRDACTGDGGAALACIVGGRYYLAGLVAWGIGCGDANVPGVYVRIPSYSAWIFNITQN